MDVSDVWALIMEYNSDRDFYIGEIGDDYAGHIDVTIYRDAGDMDYFVSVLRDCGAIIVTPDDRLAFQGVYPYNHWLTDPLFDQKWALQLATMLAVKFGKPIVFQEVK